MLEVDDLRNVDSNAVVGTDMFGNVCRRSSSGLDGVAGGSVVRRTASMVVPVSAIEQAMLSGHYDAATAGWSRSQQAIVTARPTSILDGMSRSCSALPSHADGLDDDGLLLPPSPFRSPDFDDDDEDSSCLDGVLASCGYAAPASLPPPPNDDVGGGGGAPQQGQHAANGHRDRHLTILADLGRHPTDGGNFVWTSLPSPDDVTPTNENQPHGFGPNRHLTSTMPPPVPPPLGDKCPPVRHSDL